MTSTRHPDTDDELFVTDERHDEGAISVLRRGLAETPEARAGLVATFFLGVSIAVGRLIVPILIQRALDQGVLGDDVDLGAVQRNVAVAAVVVIGSGLISWYTQRRLVLRAQEALAALRNRAFERVHQLSIADHSDTRIIFVSHSSGETPACINQHLEFEPRDDGFAEKRLADMAGIDGNDSVPLQ